MVRLFTLAEAERLLPEIERLIRAALDAKKEFEQADSALRSLNQRVMLMGGVVIDRQQVLELRASRDRGAEELKRGIEAIQERGAQVKDLDIGLVDFITMYRGQQVCLCWKLGESGISFWHGLEEGFRGRKAIDREFLENHRGEPSN
ncbi:MAG: DUF2203 domain-containing protein [Bryobacteraceae bacterium]